MIYKLAYVKAAQHLLQKAAEQKMSCPFLSRKENCKAVYGLNLVIFTITQKLYYVNSQFFKFIAIFSIFDPHSPFSCDFHQKQSNLFVAIL